VGCGAALDRAKGYQSLVSGSRNTALGPALDSGDGSAAGGEFNFSMSERITFSAVNGIHPTWWALL